MTPAQNLAAALPADPADDGPIGVDSHDLRALLEADRFPRRWIVGGPLEAAAADAAARHASDSAAIPDGGT